MNTQLIKTSEKIEIKDYPYGFKLRTTLIDSIEFDKNKGYRHVTQTINPKTGQLNKPKKSTYGFLKIRYYDQDRHIKIIDMNMYRGEQGANQVCKFLRENHELFEKQEIIYFLDSYISSMRINIPALVVYCGADLEATKNYYIDFIKIACDALENLEKIDLTDLFSKLILDLEKIETLKFNK